MVVTGLAALSFINVPVFSALRRFTTLIVIVGERLILNKRVPTDEAYSVYTMVFGAVIAGAGDLTFSLIGYILCTFNCLVTAGYLVYITKTKEWTKLDTFGLMFYNNILSIPFVSLVVYVVEWEGLLSYSAWFDLGFMTCFLMSSIQAFLLNYFIFLCSTINSPLTTSVAGQIKAILTTVIGLFIFGDVQYSHLLAVGLMISTVGGVWYSHIKYLQTKRSSSSSSSASAASQPPASSQTIHSSNSTFLPGMKHTAIKQV